MEDILKELVAFIQNAAPVLWEAAYRQAYVTAIFNAGWALVGVVGAYLSYRLAKHGLKIVRERQEKGGHCYHDPDPWDVDTMGMVICGGVAAPLLTLLAIVSTSEVLARLINPTYYAILILVRMIPGGGR